MKFRQMGIRTQLRWVILIMFAVFLAVSLLIGRSTREALYHTEDEHIRLNTERLGNQLNLLTTKMQTLCTELSEDERLGRLLSRKFGRTSDWMHGIENFFASYLARDPVIEDVALISDLVHYSGVYSAEELDEIAGQMEGRTACWLGFRPHTFVNQAGRPDMFCFAANVALADSEQRGIAVISVSTAAYNMTYEPGCFYAVTDGTRILCGFGTDTAEAESALALTKGGGEDSLQMDHLWVHTFQLEDPGYFLISGMNTDRAGVSAQMRRIRFLIYASILVGAALCALFVGTMVLSLIRPLAQFDRRIREIRERKSRVHEPSGAMNGCAEITQISQEFDLMLQDLEELNEKIVRQTAEFYELKLEKQEAELAYLKSQINPHFLYNTLEAIRSMAVEKDAPQIAQMTTDMASIFRYSAKGEDAVCLEDEIRITEAYVRIQQQRFDGKIEVYYFIPEELYPCRVMKMLLQPLVENAIFHGLEPKKEGGSLFVGARAEGDRLIVTIKDDGTGIPNEKLKQLQAELEQENVDTSAHVGVLNTHARLRLQYGKKSGLRIESEEGDGTTVTVTLPRVPGTGAGQNN